MKKAEKLGKRRKDYRIHTLKYTETELKAEF